MKKQNLSIPKYPDIEVPKYSNIFSVEELQKVIKLYKVDEVQAREILKEKFYGAEKPYGYNCWAEYWIWFSEI